MSAIKRFVEEVSCIIGRDGKITDLVGRVTNEAIKKCNKAGLKMGEHTSQNPKFVEIVKESRRELRKAKSRK